MDTLTSMRAFVGVAELGSFSGAARRMEISPAMVTKHVAHLEARVGVALLTRTTRRVSLTEAGAAYLRQCVEVLRLVEEADDEVGRQRNRPSGTLRVTAPIELGNRHLAPLVAPLLAANPDMSVHFDFTNRVVDLAEEGVDVAVRVSPRQDSALSGRQVAMSRLVPVAAPSRFRRQGLPRVPQDLGRHPALVFGVGDWSRWPCARGSTQASVAMTARMRSTSSEALRLAALDGAGVSLLPTFLVDDDLREGRLLALLTDWDFGRLHIHVLYPQRRHRPARVRAFVDALLGHFGGDPSGDPFWHPGDGS